MEIRNLIVEYITNCMHENYKDQIYMECIIDFNAYLIVKIPQFSNTFINVIIVVYLE